MKLILIFCLSLISCSFLLEFERLPGIFSKSHIASYPFACVFEEIQEYKEFIISSRSRLDHRFGPLVLDQLIETFNFLQMVFTEYSHEEWNAIDMIMSKIRFVAGQRLLRWPTNGRKLINPGKKTNEWLNGVCKTIDKLDPNQSSVKESLQKICDFRSEIMSLEEISVIQQTSSIDLTNQMLTFYASIFDTGIYNSEILKILKDKNKLKRFEVHCRQASSFLSFYGHYIFNLSIFIRETNNTDLYLSQLMSTEQALNSSTLIKFSIHNLKILRNTFSLIEQEVSLEMAALLYINRLDGNIIKQAGLIDEWVVLRRSLQLLSKILDSLSEVEK